MQKYSCAKNSMLLRGKSALVHVTLLLECAYPHSDLSTARIQMVAS